MLIDQINLNQLRVFQTVFESRSMTKAAQDLNLTQSGVSQHIRALEDMLEIKLFDRVRQRLVPTAPAALLFENCQRNFQSIEEMLSQIKAGQNRLLGSVALGMPIEFGNNIVMPLVAEFCKEHPLVNVKIRMGFISEMNDGLLAGDLDFAFVDTFRLDKRIQTQELFDELLYLCSSEDYFKQHKSTLEKKRGLEELDFIAYQEGAPVIKAWFKQQLGKTHVELRVRANVMDVQGVAKLVCSSLGCGVLPAYLVSKLQSQGKKFHIFDEGKKEVHNKIHLASLRGKSLIPAAQALREFLLERISHL